MSGLGSICVSVGEGRFTDPPETPALNRENGVMDDTQETVFSRHSKAGAEELTETMTACMRFV